ncbi:bifunctional phosphoribosyl-AMP cyclohydrolase/phosphoribosyl-ATP diphosphatase HisIE [Hymenobacter sp. BT770]|uniref:bifunctional phosphoribosyl-AMP cyclohydrolase/phosphoribosyl-ATP diphosphatase HisIE n=1 Tax=Hymenobacter sp. BT770 TaxID=2886942 RepID=UPI001D12F781|nr:bifunctional phosphoribosyl-AMP cyclohydrolase/phosphoribosyl-ATP diphosphatase HisIE [Hymenobacter sp. BT770]MCC3152980.1 bifunctional phosphoribosyl-AMP cyclohydrolase/phosphoribosyl-ATP diphosphatase HisIE [Hymenobacter sp. BT770]MDO3415106.1 bifunctional phosphoribosyl-AMP cyclohydrolase/phosphoribosyl-ATP diphosphatase HisIE [Hymenobacter sp. BT770]
MSAAFSHPATVRFDPATGLLPAIVQDADTGQVLMLGYMNEEAWAKTQQDGRVTFFSRSKNRLWVKGESSGNFLTVVSLHVDCDADTVLIRAIPAGPTCHRGTVSCFEQPEQTLAPAAPIGFLAGLERLIVERHKFPERAPTSYTVSLFNKGIAKIAQKVGEEAVETVIDAVGGNRETLPSEVADLLYHLLVLLVASGVPMAEVISVLQERHRLPNTRHLTEG